LESFILARSRVWSCWKIVATFRIAAGAHSLMSDMLRLAILSKKKKSDSISLSVLKLNIPTYISYKHQHLLERFGTDRSTSN